MGNPKGPLLRALAKRVLANLEYIDERSRERGQLSPQMDNAPFTETQLLISTLGFLVFPHERTPDALGQVLVAYHKSFKLSDVMTILHPRQTKGGQAFEISGEDGRPVNIDPGTIKSLPRLLRNSVAHFNVRPIESQTYAERWKGVRVWNTDPEGNITFVADMKFDQLRELAKFVLKAFSDQGQKLTGINDPDDPMKQLLKGRRGKKGKSNRVPGLNKDHWRAALKIWGGDPDQAKTWIDRTIKAGIDKNHRESLPLGYVKQETDE